MAYRTLVTGGAGFIGSHLVQALVAQGSQVRILDNFATGSPDNLTAVREQIELIKGDLRDPARCAAACRDIEVVFHLGALGSVPRSIADPVTSDAVNVQGTLQILLAARDAGVRRLVFSSSSSVYGDTPILPKHEGMRPNPRSPYAVSKLAGEEYCRAFTYAYGLETVALRYFNVFGPRQSPNSQYAAVIPRFLSALMEGRRPVLYGDGQQSRDFTYVSNVVEANLLASEATEVAGEVFNIACGEQVSVSQVLEKIACLLDCPCDPERLPPRTGDVKHSRADIHAAAERLGYCPQVLFDAGLRQTVKAFLASHNAAHSAAIESITAANQ